jgi:predicted AAA+ superfamily ATPase
LKPFSLNFVYGARQVGKTTGLKLLIRDLIRSGKTDPKSVFYIDLDYLVPSSATEYILVEKRKRGLRHATFF